MNKSSGRMSLKAPRTASPVLRRFFHILDETGTSFAHVARVIGSHRVTLSNWRHGHTAPNLPDFERALQVLGYRLEIVEIATNDRRTMGGVDPLAKSEQLHRTNAD